MNNIGYISVYKENDKYCFSDLVYLTNLSIDINFDNDKNAIYDISDINLNNSKYKFSYYKELIYALRVYSNLKEEKIFMIEVFGDISDINNLHMNKYTTDKFKILKEVTKDEIKEYLNYNSEKLYKNDDMTIRCILAKYGCVLDKLINDESYSVRCVVANQGYGLNILINDENPLVRQMVARHGYGLDILINDKNAVVRGEVARQGYGLDILINDKDPYVKNAAKILLQGDKDI